MEDALVHEQTELFLREISVLILVLMEDALVLILISRIYPPIRVLILVLMEDALVQVRHEDCIDNWPSLNPCFNGRCTSTIRS